MGKLAAKAMAEDPRIAEAKRLLRETLRDHQAGLTGIRPADPELRQGYLETLARFGNLRGASLYYPYLGSGMGRGALVELADGSVKYDFITGIGVHYMGHNHPDLLDAGVEAALDNTVMQGNLQQNAQSEELLALLLRAANRVGNLGATGKAGTAADGGSAGSAGSAGKGARMAHGFLTSSGAMANENALKIIFQKRFPAHRVLAFEHCFAGRTIALSQVTDKAAYRQGVPETLAVDYVPFYDPARPEASTAEAVAAVKSHLARHPGAHACMIFELIQGEGGGYVPGTPEFFRALMEILRAAGVAVFADEIQTFGRTSEYFAFQHFGLEDLVDVVTLGKLSQACATLIREEFKPKAGLVSQTFTAPSAAIRSALVIVRHMEERGFLGADGKIMRLSRCFTEKLKDLAMRRPDLAAGPFGMGGMIAFTPLGGDPDQVAKYLKNLFDAGVIGFIAGGAPAKARFLLPVGGVEESDIEAVFPILERVLIETADAGKAGAGGVKGKAQA